MTNGLTTHADGSIQLSRERFMLCMEAIWELDAIAASMRPLANELRDGNAAGLVLRALNCRTGILTSALMSGLNDTKIETEELRDRVMLTSDLMNEVAE